MCRIVALFIVIILVGCVGIQKPDWNPGTTKTASQTVEKATCPLSAEWVWNKEHAQWVCVVSPPRYYGPMYYPYYGPYFYPYFGPPVWFGFHFDSRHRRH